MAAAAVPAISLGAQFFANRGANKRAQAATSAATTGLQTSGANLTQAGNQLAGQAGGFLGDSRSTLQSAGQAYGQAGSYFSPLLSGSRGAMDQALAPDRAAITDTYRGASNALSGMRGGQRDLAQAELNRDRAGRLSLLAPTARAGAAQGMLQVGQGRTGVGGTQGGIGTSLAGQSVAAHGGATSPYSSLYQGAQQQDLARQHYANQSGSAIGSMIFDAMKASGGRKAGGSAGAPSLAGGAPPVGTNFWSGVTAPRFN